MTQIDYGEAAAGLASTNAIRKAFSGVEGIWLKPRLSMFNETVIDDECVMWQTAAQSAHMLTQYMVAFRCAAAGQKTLCLLSTFMNVKTFANELRHQYSQKTGEQHPHLLPQIIVDNNEEGGVLSINAPSDDDMSQDDVLIHVATYATATKNNLHENYDALVIIGNEERSLTCEFFYMKGYKAPTTIHMGVSDAPHSIHLLENRNATPYFLNAQDEHPTPDTIDDMTYTVQGNDNLSPLKSKKAAIDETIRLIRDGHTGIFMMLGDWRYSVDRVQRTLANEASSVEVVDINDKEINVPPKDGAVKVIVGPYFQCVNRLRSFHWLTAGVSDGYEKISLTVTHMNRKSSRMKTIQEWYINKAASFLCRRSPNTPHVNTEFVVLRTPVQSDKALYDELFEMTDTSSFFRSLTRLRLAAEENIEEVFNKEDFTHAMAMGIVDQTGLTDLGERVMDNRELVYRSHVFMTHVINHPKSTPDAIAAALPIAALLNVRSMYSRSVKFPHTIQKNDPWFDSSITAEVIVFLHHMKTQTNPNHLPKEIQNIPSPLTDDIRPIQRMYENVNYTLWLMMHVYLDQSNSNTQHVTNEIYRIYMGDKQSVLDKDGDVSHVIKACMAATFVDDFYVCVDRKATRRDMKTPLGIPGLNVYDDDLVCGFPYNPNDEVALLTRPTLYEWSEISKLFEGLPFVVSMSGTCAQVFHAETGRIVSTIESPSYVQADTKMKISRSSGAEGTMGDKLRDAIGS